MVSFLLYAGFKRNTGSGRRRGDGGREAERGGVVIVSFLLVWKRSFTLLYTFKSCEKKSTNSMLSRLRSPGPSCSKPD